MITVRPYTAQDYDMVREWWTAWGWDILPENHLPTVGAIASHEGIDICAAWLYRTDSAFALLEWFVSAPKRHPLRKQALSSVTEELTAVAKYLGFSSVVTFTRNPHLLNLLRESSFEAESGNITSMVRVL